MNPVHAYIDEHFDRFVDELKRMCAQPSVSTKHIGIEEMARLLVDLMRAKGIDARTYPTPGHPIVVGQAKGQADRTLLFYNHYDTQPEDPLEKWTTPPFEPTIRDGRLYARGATDNKGNIISRLAAVEAILKVRGALPVNLKFLVDGEEEIASPNLPEFCRQNKDLLAAEGCIWEDTMGRVDAPVVSLGNKGNCYVEVRCRTANTDFHSSFAGVYPNALWRLVWALSTVKGPDERVLVEGFYDDVRPLSPDEEELVRKIPPIDAEDRKRRFGMKRLAAGQDGPAATRRIAVEPTCNIAAIVGGFIQPGRKTVLPAEALAKMDIRLVADQDPVDIHQKLVRHFQKHGFDDVEVTLVSAGRPSRTAYRTRLNEVIKEASLEVYGKQPIFEPNGPGSTPCWVADQVLGLPVASTGVGYVTALSHAPDENIDLEHLRQGMKWMATIIERF